MKIEKEKVKKVVKEKGPSFVAGVVTGSAVTLGVCAVANVAAVQAVTECVACATRATKDLVVLDIYRKGVFGFLHKTDTVVMEQPVAEAVGTSLMSRCREAVHSRVAAVVDGLY